MAKVNRNYCKPDAEMKPVYAPAVFRYNGKDYWHPEKEDYALVGYLPLSPDWPVDPPEGKHYVQTDKIEANGDEGWRWAYVLVDDPPPPPRRWTRLALKTALAQAEMLDAAKAYLSGVEVATGYTAWEALTDADYIEEGYPNAERWSALLDGAAVALGKTRAIIDAFLDTVPTEGGV